MKKFAFTYEDIAKTTGLSVQTIKNKVVNKEFDPKVLNSLSCFIAKYVLEKAQK